MTVGQLRGLLAQFDDDDTVRLEDAVPSTPDSTPDRLEDVERRLGALEWDFAELQRRLDRERRHQPDTDDDAA